MTLLTTDEPGATAPVVVEQVTEAEARFELWRQRVGRILAPLLFLYLLWDPSPSLEPAAQRLAAVMATVVVLWISEALPLPITALLGAAGCVVLGVAPAEQVFAPFADPLMFLFIGSFMLARAIYVHGLDRRLAFGVLSWPIIGGRPTRVMFAFGAVTVVLSAWMSNTATTAMMFSIGMSILSVLMAPGHAVHRRYATGLMLMTSFSASIGGLATPVGSPPNLIGLGYVKQLLGREVTFFEWMIVGVPVVGLTYLFLFGYLSWFCHAGVKILPGGIELLRQERDRLGRWTTAERSTLGVFLGMALLWILPGVVALIWGNADPWYRFLKDHFPEAVVALLGASLLFILPGRDGHRVLTWSDATQIDWGIVLLYGGGFSLGILSQKTGLADALGQWLTDAVPLSQGWALLIVSTAIAALVSEVTSNTASANIVIPVVIAYAQNNNLDPLPPALGATFGASLGFMLPVSTPCNAIVYASGFVPISRMMRYGLWLDIAGVTAIVILVGTLSPWLSR